MSESAKGNEYEAFLTSVGDLVEADIVTALLESEGIPVRKKHNLTGDYLEVFANITPFGIDLYVPPEELDRAKELIAAPVEITDEEVFSAAEAIDAVPEEKSKSEKCWLFRKNAMRLMILAGIIVSVGFILATYVMNLLDI